MTITPTALVISQLNKKFGSVQVLDEVTFTCPPGTVTAFLGPNGAGKSTTLRITAGLSQAQSGSVRFGERRLQDFRHPAQVVGFSLDAATFHPGRTVIETLHLTALACGLRKSAATAQVERVGLGSVRNRRVKKLSLGMRQRLALGCALMGDPSVLVLDEPVNGLDIEGVLWIRQLVTEHARAGGTVLLATHLLREAQGLADRVVMIDRGKIVANAHPDELIDDSWSTANTAQPEKLAQLLHRTKIEFQQNKTQFTVRCTPEALGELTAAHRLPLTRLDTAADSNLERIFLDRTSGEFAIPTEKILDPS